MSLTMKIEIAKHERMSETGSSLLRLIQNNDIPRLDLLVRESVQNSLDAGDRKSEHESIQVDFVIKTVVTEEISECFNEISERLNELYPGSHTYIEIKDSHTTGLTGPLSINDVPDNNQYGNLQKLVYEISKPQEQAGSGGSWGLGKTVYFRMGAGMVVYYSHIYNENDKCYESRLAAALVEDENSPRAILKRTKLGRGIAWWGQSDPTEANRTIPLTNEQEIQKILDLFQVQPFKEHETGTAIIIPFVNEQELLKETEPDLGDSGKTAPYWTKSSIEDYLKISLQRWYAPRIDNHYYRYGQYLCAKVNNNEVSFDNMSPLFKLIQTLYNSSDEKPLGFNGNQILSEKVGTKKIFDRVDTSAGLISFVKVGKSDMGMMPPQNLPSPYFYINKFSETIGHPPIVMFTRRPGMIVAYDTNGEWANGIPSANEDEYIIALFKANSENMIAQLNISLDDYLRRGEMAVHNAWSDWSDVNKTGFKQKVVERIQRGVSKKILEKYGETNRDESNKPNNGLGKMLADLLLPENDYSDWDEGNGGGSGDGGSGGDGSGDGGSEIPPKTVSNHFGMRKLSDTQYLADYNVIELGLSFGKNDKAALIMLVQSEGGLITSKNWEDEVGTPFPVNIEKVIIKRVSRGKGKRKTVLQDNAVELTDSRDLGDLKIAFVHTDKFNVIDTICIDVADTVNFEVDLQLCYKANRVHGTVDFRKRGQ